MSDSACTHDHLVRDSNLADAYSCEVCGIVFAVEPYGEDQRSDVVMGVPK